MTVVLVSDVSGPLREHRGQPYLIDWLVKHGIDPMLCYRFEVLADGDGHLRVFEYDPPKRLNADRQGVVVREPYLVPLVAPIPKEFRLDGNRR